MTARSPTAVRYWEQCGREPAAAREVVGMAAQKPRTGDGPMEAVREGKVIVVKIPLEGGGRLVISVTPDEAGELRDALAEAVA
jgi:hypothetical protein